MKKILLVILVVIISTNFISAQKLSLSPLTYFGIGEINFQGNTSQLSMGNTGIGNFTNFHISKVNPASISALGSNQAVFEFGLFHRISIFDDGTEPQLNNLSNFRYIYGGFRIASWWHTSFGISPYSSSGYKIIIKDSLQTGDYTSNYNLIYEGIGSINQVFWGNSFTIFNKLSFGANINYNFGSFDREQSVLMTTDSDFISITVSKNRNLIKKINFDFGLIYADTIRKNQKEFMRFSIGAIYSNKTNINSIETKYTYRNISYLGLSFTDSLNYDTIGNSKIELPQSLGFGISMTFNNKYTFAADYLYKKWAGNEILGQNNFNNSKFIALGFEYCESPLSSRYYKTIRYNIGAYQNNSYMSFNNKQVITQGLTAGIGLPLRTVMLNLGFTYGQTGSLDLGLKENFYEFNLGVTLYDIWFIKRKFE